MVKLMSIDGVGVSSASKIIGLSDQNSLAIYDSYVGAALETLTNDGNKFIKSPPGLNRAGDLDCSPIDWAENCQKLLWVLEVVRNELNDAGPFQHFRRGNGVHHNGQLTPKNVASNKTLFSMYFTAQNQTRPLLTPQTFIHFHSRFRFI